MKEHEDDVMRSVEKSTAVDEIVTEGLGGGEGKAEGFLADSDEGEDMMVDVVGADAVDDDHGRAGVNLDSEEGSDGLVEECMEKETETQDLDVGEVAGSGEDVCDASVGSRVLTFEKVEVMVNKEDLKRSVQVSKDVIQGNVVTTVASGSNGDAQKSGTWVRDSKMAFGSLSGEPQVGGGDIAVISSKEPTEIGSTKEVVEQHVESVEEVVDSMMDKKNRKEAEILDSSIIANSSFTTANLGSQEVDMVVVVEGFTSKDEAEDSISVNPSLVCPNNRSSSTVVVNAGTGEVDRRSKEESLHPTIEVITDDAQGNETVDSLSREPRFVGGENAVIDREEESDRGMSEEVMEQPMECDQELADGDLVVNEKIGKEDEALDSSKISEPSTTTNPGYEDGDVVVEGLASNDEADNVVSVDPSLVCPDNRSLSTEVVNSATGEGDVNVHAENLDQQAEVDKLSKKESFHPTIEVITCDAQKPENGTGVGDSKLAVEPWSGEPQFGGETAVTDREETERGLAEDKEIVEQPTEPVQEVAYGDRATDEKTGKGDEVLDSSKIPKSLTTTNLGPEEVLTRKNEAQDSDFVNPRLVCPDHRSLSTEMVNAGTGKGAVLVNTENSNQQPEVDPMSKDEIMHPTIEVISTDASHGSLHHGVEQQVVNVKPTDNSSESQTTLGGDLVSSLHTTKPFAGAEMDQMKHKVSSQSTGEHHQSVIGGDGVMLTAAAYAASVSHPEVVTAIDTKMSDLDSTQHFSVALMIDNKVCDSGKNIDDVEVEMSKFQSVDESSRTEVAACTEADEVGAYTGADEAAACTEVDEATTASEVLNSEVQVPSAGGMDALVENQRLKVNAVPDSSRPDVAACAEPESSIDQTIPSTANKVIEVDSEGQNCKVELPITGDKSRSVEDQGLKAEAVSRGSIIDAAACARPSNDQVFNSGDEVPTLHIGISNSTVEIPSTGEMNGFQVTANAFEEVNGITPCADVAKHCVLPEDSEFSYEEAHMERGEDAGMDIDEVLGWKDEMPGIDVLSGSAGCAGKDQHFKINANSEADVEQGLSKSSCKPVLIAQREENFKFRQPIVYERRVHVEVPLYDALDGSRSPLLEDENLKVETDSEEDDGSVQEEEQKVVGQSTRLSRVDEMVNEERSTLAPLDTVSGGSHHLEAHVNEAKDSGTTDKEHHSLPLVEDDSKLVENSADLHACLDERGNDEFTEVGSLMGMEVDVEEHSGTREQTDFCREQKTEALEHGSEAEQFTGADVATKPLENESSFLLHQSCYFQPPENEGQFSVSDLVWGKVRSHPWWPGQIFDPSDASEKAMKYHKKECFLVAYFGDRTFAWNDSAVLKPFRANFSQIEKHTNSEAFKNAVRCALEEVCRRVELGLACSCVPQDIYEKIEYQVVENGGIRQESNRRYGTDESASVSSFDPDKLVDYVRLLAQFPGEGDKMELAMAKAQLSSYGRYKGYRRLSEFQFCGDMLEDASILCEGVEQVNKDGEKISERRDIPGKYNASHKFEYNLMDGAYPNKERSLSDLTDDAPYSVDGDGAEGGHITSNLVSSSGFKKRKALDSIYDGLEKRPSLCPDKVPTDLTSTPRPSFKVGECIQRVASQLTGPPSVLKSNSDTKVEHGQHADQLVGFTVSLQIPENSLRGRMIVEGKQSSVAEMLSQLHLAAQDPMKGYSFLNTIIPFFYSHRSAVFSKSIRQNSSIARPVVVRKRKMSNENDPEEFEFDDVNDSYWTDRIIQNHSEEQLLQDNQNGGLEYQVVAYEPDKPTKASRRSNKKRFFSSNHEIEVKEQLELVERRRQNLATEVALKFTEGIYFPSEIHLNKMFRRFGPLMESETEVDRERGRARVVFKKCSDAEVAHSSAGKFNIFGSINVNYELNYAPLVSYKPLPLSILQDPMDAS